MYKRQQFTEAREQLNEYEKQLETAKQEYETARTQALAQADVQKLSLIHI